MASPNTKRVVGKKYSDLYNTPEVAVEALMDYCGHRFNPGTMSFFEPCSGKGKISDKMKEYNIHMETNELFSEHGKSDFTEDFLNPRKEVADVWSYDTIISNPPYKIATEFVKEGFKYAKDQYHLLRLNFLEGKGRYKDLHSTGHLKNVYIFTGRISCTKGVEEEPQANAVCYCWFHFDRDYDGLPTLHWI